MSDSEERSAETRSLATNEDIDIVRERLELDKRRFELDAKAHETSKQLDFERIRVEKSKERTARLQLIFPILVSVLALGLSIWTATLQYRLQYAQAVSSYNETRLELFKRLADRATDSVAVKQAYSEIFPNDFKTLEAEQRNQKSPDK